MVPATATAHPTFGDQTTNSRGNLSKSIGQPAAMLNAAGDRTVEFRVDAIRTGAKCATNGYTEKPQNGQFVALDIFATTHPVFDPTSDDAEFLTAGYAWPVVTADGMRHIVDTTPAWSCSPPNRKNLGGLRGLTVQGTVYQLVINPAESAVEVRTERRIFPGQNWCARRDSNP
ncbi:hypothetical protein ACFQE5_18875 [Pseudonocardia hispaniensis]|uniref:DUF4232 domain-containing protein n=1 Tax=Pseudonocardia hispaniensis TaxID=904933 RepID=A0ABW1J745_9PSEU